MKFWGQTGPLLRLVPNRIYLFSSLKIFITIFWKCFFPQASKLICLSLPMNNAVSPRKWDQSKCIPQPLLVTFSHTSSWWDDLMRPGAGVWTRCPLECPSSLYYIIPWFYDLSPDVCPKHTLRPKEIYFSSA